MYEPFKIRKHLTQLRHSSMTPSKFSRSFLGTPRNKSTVLKSSLAPKSIFHHRLPSLNSSKNTSFVASKREKLRKPKPPSTETDSSTHCYGYCKSFGYYSTPGLIRSYNEDKVSIVQEVPKPSDQKGKWPKCSYFAVFDGHGGESCSEYLKNHLHNFIFASKYFPQNPREALLKGFEAAEEAFLNAAFEKSDNSGSCAIVVLIVENFCYIANTGDSRAIMSFENGKRVCGLTRDHKPDDERERQRIVDAGGKVYRTQLNPSLGLGEITGPSRIFPGRISVSRSFGDLQAKDYSVGGNPNVLIATPEISSFKILKCHDFIVMGSDGLYDKVSNEEIASTALHKLNKKGFEIHKLTVETADKLVKLALDSRSQDNVTCLVIVLPGFSSK